MRVTVKYDEVTRPGHVYIMKCYFDCGLVETQYLDLPEQPDLNSSIWFREIDNTTWEFAGGLNLDSESLRDNDGIFGAVSSVMKNIKKVSTTHIDSNKTFVYCIKEENWLYTYKVVDSRLDSPEYIRSRTSFIEMDSSDFFTAVDPFRWELLPAPDPSRDDILELVRSCIVLSKNQNSYEYTEVEKVARETMTLARESGDSTSCRGCTSTACSDCTQDPGPGSVCTACGKPLSKSSTGVGFRAGKEFYFCKNKSCSEYMK